MGVNNGGGGGGGGGVVPILPSAWQAVTAFTNGWVNYGGVYETAAYLKDQFGIVHLKGIIQSGANSTAAFTLPVGYRPGATGNYGAAPTTAGVDAVVQIASSGNVTPVSTATSVIALSGITFLAEN